MGGCPNSFCNPWPSIDYAKGLVCKVGEVFPHRFGELVETVRSHRRGVGLDPQNHPFAHISLKRSRAAGAPMRSMYYPRPGLGHPPAPLDCACCWGELGCGLRWHYGRGRLNGPFWALKWPNSTPDFPKIDVSGGISPSWGPLFQKTLGECLAKACRSKMNSGFAV